MRRLWIAIVVAALAGMAAATTATGHNTTPANNVAIGDSITNNAAGEIDFNFQQASWTSHAVFGLSGYRIDQLRPTIQYMAGYTPTLKRMWIHAGANDAFQYAFGQRDDNQLLQSVFHLYAAVDDVRSRRPRACVFLATLYFPPPSPIVWPYNAEQQARFRHAADVLNENMRRIIDDDPKVYGIPWSKLSREHDASTPPSRDWIADGIGHLTDHPTGEDGQWAFANRYVSYGRLPSGCG